MDDETRQLMDRIKGKARRPPEKFIRIGRRNGKVLYARKQETPAELTAFFQRAQETVKINKFWHRILNIRYGEPFQLLPGNLGRKLIRWLLS